MPRYVLEIGTLNINHMFPPNQNIFSASHIHSEWRVQHKETVPNAPLLSQWHPTAGRYTPLKPNRSASAPTLSSAATKFSHHQQTIFWLLSLPVISTCARRCPWSCLILASIYNHWNTTALLCQVTAMTPCCRTITLNMPCNTCWSCL